MPPFTAGLLSTSSVAGALGDSTEFTGTRDVPGIQSQESQVRLSLPNDGTSGYSPIIEFPQEPVADVSTVQ